MEQVPRGGPETKGKRYSVTLRGLYVYYLDRFVEQGVYHDEQDMLRAGLMLLLQHHGVDLYTKKGGLVPS